jgi:electron transfer flavoprotein alpha/beta subunit
MVAFRCPQVAWQYQTPIRFQTVKQGLILEQEAEKSTYLNELDAREPLVVSISQRSEELRLYNLV